MSKLHGASQKRLLLASTGLGTVLTTMSFLGATQSALASTLVVTSLNTFVRQLSTGNVSLSGTTVSLTANASTASGNFITFTMPSGITFAANPSVGFSTGASGAVNLSTGGSGSQSIVYALSATFTSGSTFSLSGIQISGLQTYITTNSTATVFNIGATFTNDTVTAATASLSIANLTDAASATPAAGAAQTIDVASGGTRWVSGTGTALFIPLGTVAYANIGGNDVSGASAVSMSPTGGAITVTGPLSGVSTLYAAAGVTTCATAAPSNAFSATPSATAGTITGLSLSTFQVCAIANGSTILQNGTMSVRGTLTTTNSQSVTGTTTGNAVGYSGSVRTVNFFVGTSASYQSYAYAVNSSTSASTALVSVRRSDGATAIGTLTSLAAGTSALYGAADVNTAVGSTFLTNSDSRAQVTFLFGSSSVKLTGLLANPGGSVTTMGQTFSD